MQNNTIEELEQLRTELYTQFGHYVCTEIIKKGANPLIIQQTKEHLEHMCKQAMSRPWEQMTAKEIGDITAIVQALTH
jgi:hypothetical protein